MILLLIFLYCIAFLYTVQRAGRPKSEDLHMLHSLFESFQNEIVTSEKKIIGRKAEIWNKIKQTHNQTRTINGIYVAATKWWKDFQNDERSDQGNVLPEVSIETSYESNKSNDCETTFSSNGDTVSPQNDEIHFNIFIGAKVWQNIKPVECQYNRKADSCHKQGIRKYKTMKPGVWSNVIANKIVVILI